MPASATFDDYKGAVTGAAGLVGYWPLVGGSTTDASGHNFDDGVWSGATVGTAAGPFSGQDATVLKGAANGDTASMLTIPDLFTTNDDSGTHPYSFFTTKTVPNPQGGGTTTTKTGPGYTIEAWVKWPKDSSNDPASVDALKMSGGDNLGVSLNSQFQKTQFDASFTGVWHRGGTTNEGNTSNFHASYVNDDKWHFVVHSLSNKGPAVLYVDGHRVASSNQHSQGSSGGGDTDSPWMGMPSTADGQIGYREGSGAGEMEISNVAVYRRPLTLPEMVQQYALSGHSSYPPAFVKAMMKGGKNASMPCVECQMVKNGIGDPITSLTGDFTESATDLAVPSRGAAPAATRYYDSDAGKANESGLFGRGWVSQYSQSLDVTPQDGATPASVTWTQESGSQVVFNADAGSSWVAASNVSASLSGLVTTSPSTWVATRSDGTKFTFTVTFPPGGGVGRGTLTSITDANGYVTTLNWSASSLVVTAHHTVGDTSSGSASGTLTFDLGSATGPVSAVHDSAGRTITYHYTNGELDQVSSLGGGLWKYGYNTAGQLTTMTDPTKATTKNDYYDTGDYVGRVKEQWDPNASAASATSGGTQFSYDFTDPNDPFTGTTTITSPATSSGSAVEQLTFREGYVVKDVKNADASDPNDIETTTFNYDAATGMPTEVEDSNGNYTFTDYTQPGSGAPIGLPLTVTDPAGTVTTYAGYTAYGHPGYMKVTGWDTLPNEYGSKVGLGHNNADQPQTWYYYDPTGRFLKQVSTPGNPASVTKFTYGGPGLPDVHPEDVTSIQAPDGKVTALEYDDATGLKKSVTDPAGGKTTYGYDAAGHQTWTVSPNGNVNGATATDFRSVAVVNAAGEMLASVPANGAGAADGFVRAGSASSLGAAATGESWSAVTGTWGVAGGAATLGSAGSGGRGVAKLPYDDSNTSTAAVSSVVADGLVDGAGVAFRVKDSGNYYAIANRPGSDSVDLLKVFGGSAATLDTASGKLNTGDRVTVLFANGLFLVYRNGTVLFASGDNDLADQMGAGLYAEHSGSAVSAGFEAHSFTHTVNSETVNGGFGSHTGYDLDGRPVATDGPTMAWFNVARTAISYDADGHVTASTDANGTVVTSNGWDALGRRCWTLTAASAGSGGCGSAPSGATTWSYDGLGRLTSTQAPGKPATTINYTWLVPATSTTTSATEAVPATSALHKADGTVVTSALDELGRQTSVYYGSTLGGTPDETYIYDRLGRTVVSNARGVATYASYDLFGDAIAVNRDGQLVVHSYNSPGKVATITYPGSHTVTEGYDSYGRWNSVQDWNSNQTNYGYGDADGNITQVDTPDGVRVTRSYDPSGAPAGVQVGTSGTPSSLASWAYTRNSDATLASVTASGVGSSTDFGYDLAGQVTSPSADPATPPRDYAYNAAQQPTIFDGNVQVFDSSGELCWTATYANAGLHRSCASTPSTYTDYGYNDNGDRTSAGSATFGYDAVDEMTSSTVSGTTTSYAYDAAGLRTSKTTGTTTMQFAWDSSTSVPELIGDGGNYYLYGPDGLPTERTGTDATIWLHQDATGSVRLTTNKDANGDPQITSSESYTPWGTVTASTGNTPTLGYDSQYSDPESGLVYLRARYYDPATGQFLTPDPLIAATGERYGYAGNDPLNSGDPTGLSWYNPCVGTTCASDVASHAAHDVAAAPGHIAHDVNNDVVKPVGRNACVTVANSNCESYASSTTWGHDVLVGSELVLGASLLVASFGTLAAPEAGAFGLTASQTSQLIALGSIGNGASALPRCLAGDGVACAVAGLGIGAGGLGLAGLGASEWALGAGAFGRVGGLLGWTLNATYRLSRAVCHR